VLLGKYVPDMINKYSVGASSTTATGASAIPSVGQTGHQITIAAHTHTAPTHNHTVWDYVSGGDDNTYNSSGSSVATNTIVAQNGGSGDIGIALIDKSAADGNDGPSENTGIYYASTNLYTDNQAGTTSSNGGSTQNIQPESIQVIKLIRVI
jgi:hypothetical protein